MRIVTFNVQHARTPGGPVDTEALARYCAGLGADVLGLQELDVGVARSRRADQVAAVARATGMQAAFGEARRVGTLGFRGRYGNALLVRGAMARVETLPLPRMGRAEPRVAVLASAVVDRAAVSTAVVHLSVRRAEASAQLEAVMAALEARPGPRLLLGDLNLRADVAGPTLTARGFTVADLAVATYPARDPFLRIDHVAVQGLDLRTTTVLGAAPVSDHRALMVEVA